MYTVDLNADMIESSINDNLYHLKGTPGDLKHRGGGNTRKTPDFCIFIGHHHHFNSLNNRDKKFPGVEFACFLFITGARYGS